MTGLSEVATSDYQDARWNDPLSGTAQSSSSSVIQSQSRSHAASYSEDVTRNPNTLVMIVTRRGFVERRKNTVEMNTESKTDDQTDS